MKPWGKDPELRMPREERRNRNPEPPKTSICPRCKIKLPTDDLEDNGLCAVCNGAETNGE